MPWTLAPERYPQLDPCEKTEFRVRLRRVARMPGRATDGLRRFPIESPQALEHPREIEDGDLMDTRQSDAEPPPVRRTRDTPGVGGAATHFVEDHRRQQLLLLEVDDADRVGDQPAVLELRRGNVITREDVAHEGITVIGRDADAATADAAARKPDVRDHRAHLHVDESDRGGSVELVGRFAALVMRDGEEVPVHGERRRDRLPHERQLLHGLSRLEVDHRQAVFVSIAHVKGGPIGAENGSHAGMAGSQ